MALQMFPQRNACCLLAAGAPARALLGGYLLLTQIVLIISGSPAFGSLDEAEVLGWSHGCSEQGASSMHPHRCAH